MEKKMSAPEECCVIDPVSGLRTALGTRSIVLIGMMGAGKTSLGKRLAGRLELPFFDADHEIEIAAGMSISEIFAERGEDEFRHGEARVIARLLDEQPKILATGGGAFMNPQTRARIAKAGISVWLRAEFDVLMRRVRKRPHRPLLQTPDPEGIMRKLIEERSPVYALADVIVDSFDAPQDQIVNDVITALAAHFKLPRTAS